MNFFKRSLILVLVSSIFCSILSPLGTLKTYAAESNSVEVKAEVLSFDAKTYLENNEYYYNVEGNIYIDKTEDNPVLLADTDNNRYIWYPNFAAYEADYHENGTPTYYVLQQDIVSIETGEVTSKIMYDNENWIDASTYEGEVQIYTLPRIYSDNTSLSGLENTKYKDNLVFILENDDYYELDEANNRIIVYWLDNSGMADYDTFLNEEYVTEYGALSGSVSHLYYDITNAIFYKDTNDTVFNGNETLLDYRYENDIWYAYETYKIENSDIILTYKKPIVYSLTWGNTPEYLDVTLTRKDFEMKDYLELCSNVTELDNNLYIDHEYTSILEYDELEHNYKFYCNVYDFEEGYFDKLVLLAQLKIDKTTGEETWLYTYDNENWIEMDEPDLNAAENDKGETYDLYYLPAIYTDGTRVDQMHDIFIQDNIIIPIDGYYSYNEDNEIVYRYYLSWDIEVYHFIMKCDEYLSKEIIYDNCETYDIKYKPEDNCFYIYDIDNDEYEKVNLRYENNNWFLYNDDFKSSELFPYDLTWEGSDTYENNPIMYNMVIYEEYYDFDGNCIDDPTIVDEYIEQGAYYEYHAEEREGFEIVGPSVYSGYMDSNYCYCFEYRQVPTYPEGYKGVKVEELEFNASEYMDKNTLYYKIDDGIYTHKLEGSSVFEYDKINKGYKRYDNYYSYEEGLDPEYDNYVLWQKVIDRETNQVSYYYMYDNENWIEAEDEYDYTYNDEGDIYYQKYYLPDIYDDGTRVNGTHREVFQDSIVFINQNYVEVDEEENKVYNLILYYDDSIERELLYDETTPYENFDLEAFKKYLTYEEATGKFALYHYDTDCSLLEIENNFQYGYGDWYEMQSTERYISGYGYKDITYITPLFLNFTWDGQVLEDGTPEVDEDIYDYQEESNSLTITDDIIVKPDIFGNYISPFAKYGTTFDKIVLDENVNEISYAFYGLEINQLVIENPDITIKTGLAGAKVNSIVFSEDVSDKLVENWDKYLQGDNPDENIPKTNENQFHTFTISRYQYQYGHGVYRPVTTTNLGTDSYALTKSKDLPKLGASSNWNIWGLEDSYLIPNQSKDTASRLVYTFFMPNDNDYCVAEEYNTPEYKDIPVVYGITATLPETEYEVGTTLSADDFEILVQGIGQTTDGIEGSYWSNTLNKWVWLKDTSHQQEAINFDTILLEKEYKKVDNKYYAKYYNYLYQNSYYLYISTDENGNEYESKYFVGKYGDDGFIYYSYNGTDWIKTDFEYSYEAERNSTYSNDKGDIYPIDMINGRDKIGSDFVKSYAYIENGKLYEYDCYDDEAFEANIKNYLNIVTVGYAPYDMESGIYWDYDTAIHKGHEYNKDLLKLENNQVYKFDFVTKSWNNTGYTTITEYKNNERDWCVDITGYYEEDGSFYRYYYQLEDGVWYKKDVLSDKKVKIDIIYICENYMPLDYDNLTSIDNITTSSISYDEDTPQMMAISNEDIVIAEGDNVITLNYYGLETTVKVKGIRTTPLTYNIKVVDEYYNTDNTLEKTETRVDTTLEENSTYTYNALTKAGYTVTSSSTFTGTLTSDITITFKYQKNPLQNYTITVIDKYFNTNGVLEKEEVRLSETKVEGNTYTYNALSKEGYSVVGNSTINGTIDSDTTIEFNYQKNNTTIKHNIIVKDIYYNENNVLEKTDIRVNVDLVDGFNYTYTALSPNGYTVISEATIQGNLIQDTVIEFKYKKAVEIIPSIVNPTPTPIPPTPTPEPIPEPTPSPEVEKIYYKVTFVVDGNNWKVLKVEAGDNADLKDIPTKEGYTFKKWDKDLQNVQSDFITNAIFEENATEKEPEVEIIFENPEPIIDIEKKNPMDTFIIIGCILIGILIPFLLILLLFINKKKIPFTYILNKEEQEMIITGYKGDEKKVLIEEEYRPFIYNYTVVEIAEEAMNGLDENGKENFNAKIEMISIPKTVRKIGKNAFKNCTNLKTIRILNKNCVIDPEAFDEGKTFQ